MPTQVDYPVFLMFICLIQKKIVPLHKNLYNNALA